MKYQLTFPQLSLQKVNIWYLLLLVLDNLKQNVMLSLLLLDLEHVEGHLKNNVRDQEGPPDNSIQEADLQT